MTVGLSGRNLRPILAVKSLAPHVLIDIMSRVLRRLLPVLVLALGACQNLTATDPNATGAAGLATTGSAPAQSTAVQNLQTISSAATTASQVGAAMGNPTVAGAGAAVAAIADAAANTAATAQTVLGTNQSQMAQKLQYADVWVSLGDPEGMKALVPYLMKPGVWMLIKCEMFSATSRHYQFMKVTAGPDIPMPEVDIFNKGRR